ncbi:MAG TPA: DUF1833 family protein [Paracoccaceae bacterium]|nr:DUF1833 family protein [Paracoccaceae bacterium]
MPRTDALARRDLLEDPAAPDALLAFLTIDHPRLAQPIRVVSDVTDYRIDGATWIGIPFDARPVTDGDGLPEGRLRMEAVTRRLPAALRAVTGRAQVALALRSSADFDLGTLPRVPAGPLPPPVYAFERFELRDIAFDPGQGVVEGRLAPVDYTAEPCPALRATQDVCPGLFW